MPLPLNPKEKILLVSSSNAGKTYQLLWYVYHTIKAGRRAFIFDADDGVAKIGREVSPFKEIADSDRLHCIPMYDWEDAMKTVEQFDKLSFQRGDLVCLEMVNYLWEWAQAAFAHSKYKKSPTEHRMEDIVEKGKNLQFGGFDGRNEWPQIKDNYFATLVPSLRTPANVIWTAGAKDLTPMDKESVKSLFEGIGVRNEGQRDVHYQVDTIVYLDYDRRSGERSWTTVKDRGTRMLLENMPLTDGEGLWDMYYNSHGLAMPWESGKK